MKFSAAAVLAAATAVSAGYAGSNVTYVTEIVEEYVTYCPGPTTITHGDQEYTVTEATTLTITDCPCTVTKPAIVSSVVECHDCPEVPAPSEPPVEEYPQPPPPPPQDNSTIPSEAPAPPPEEGEEGDQGEGEEEPPTAGAAQAAVLSGAGLAGVLGLAAFIL